MQDGGDFIRLVMDSVTERQDAHRWAFHDGDNVLHFRRIKKDIPNALFVHIIRDGRDIALSLKKMAGFAPLPWDRSETNSLVATALYWSGWCAADAKPQKSSPPITSRSATKIWLRIPTKLWANWAVSSTTISTTIGSRIPPGVHFPRPIHPSAKRGRKDQSAGPLEGSLSPENIAALEGAVGACLEENGYQLSLPAPERRISLRSSWMRLMYPHFSAPSSGSN